MSKKSRRRNKKILAALALAGGAAMLGRRGKGADAVSTAGQAFGVDRITPQSKYIQKKVVPDAAEDTVTARVPIGRMAGVGTDEQKIANQVKRAQNAQIMMAKANAPKGIIGPMRYTQPFGGASPNRLNRAYKGGGIAKRGKGAAYKSGGRVKSMGIAKRGGGAAKR